MAAGRRRDGTANNLSGNYENRSMVEVMFCTLEVLFCTTLCCRNNARDKGSNSRSFPGPANRNLLDRTPPNSPRDGRSAPKGSKDDINDAIHKASKASAVQDKSKVRFADESGKQASSSPRSRLAPPGSDRGASGSSSKPLSPRSGAEKDQEARSALRSKDDREFGPRAPQSNGVLGLLGFGGESDAMRREAARAASQEAREEKAAQQLREVQEMAGRLEGKCQKYPKTGKGALNLLGIGGLQDRYIAVVPDAEPASGSSSSSAGGVGPTGARHQLRGWRKGKLAYWEDYESFVQGKPEKGFIELMKIAKVSWNKEDSSGLTVKVKHRIEEKTFCELILKFASKSDAEKWSYACYTFVEKVREK